MKNILKSSLQVLLTSTILLLSSCEKDLYEDSLVKKQKPNVSVTMKEVKNNSEVISKLRKKFPSKLDNSVTARGADFLLTLQGDFGRVKLDNVMEVVKVNEKAFSFEIDETDKSPDVYLNLVIDKNDEIWLYKIDKIVQHYKDFPLNSERLVRFKLNSDLTKQGTTPCDTIIYPPFQPDPVENPNAGGGSFPGSGHWGDNPPTGGFFPPIIITTPGGSTGSGSGSSSGGGGGGGDFSLVSAIGDAIVEAWNWLVNLFTSDPKPQSSGCGCSHKYGNVVIVDIPANPCDDGGTIAIIPQSPVLDKIYELNDLLVNQLGYDNKMWFYSTNGLNLDYFLELAQNPPQNFDINLIPELVTHFIKTGNLESTQEIVQLAIDEPEQEEVYNLVNIVSRLDSNNDIFTDEFALTLDPYIDLDLSEQGIPPSTLSPNLLVIQTYMKYRLLRQMNPGWSKLKCAWEASKVVIHLSLDAFGLIPVVGEVADLTNGVLYTIEGDGLNATLSYASTIPIAGWVSSGTKFGIKIAETATGTTKFIWKVSNGVIEFGNRGQLRKVLNLAVGNPLVAHHIIPWAKSTNEVIQKAAKSANAFHMNSALNGIPLTTAVHNGSHAAYDQRVVDRLLEIRNTYGPNMTPDQAYAGLMDLIQDIKTAILNNPGTPINNIVF